jgi:hypothetical protein
MQKSRSFNEKILIVAVGCIVSFLCVCTSYIFYSYLFLFESERNFKPGIRCAVP